jgi:hypothetical protein
MEKAEFFDTLGGARRHQFAPRVTRTGTVRSPAAGTAALRGVVPVEVSEGAIGINGRTYKADKSKAYFEFQLACAFPYGISAYQSSFHAGTVLNSFETMRHQGVNEAHRVAAYYKGTEDAIANDKWIGAVVDVELMNRLKVSRLAQAEGDAPRIRGVAAMFKRAQGVGRILKEHLTGEHQWTVSLEAEYLYSESGVVLMPKAEGGGDAATNDVEEMAASFTPEDFKAGGYLYVPLIDAPEELFACYDETQGFFAKPFQGREVVTLMGGIDGQVHFKGMGVVRYGAEPTAKIGEILASKDEKDEQDEKDHEALLADLKKLSEVTDRFGELAEGLRCICG